MHQHTFITSEYPNYEICTGCGSYHSTAPKDPKIIYEENLYWDEGDGKTGRSTWDQQRSNMIVNDDCGVSKTDRILQFVPKRIKTALEIAASPAILVERLLDMNLDVWAIEPKSEYCQKIKEHAKEANVVQGYFPDCTKGCVSEAFDCIIAADLMEHLPLYEDYFNEIHRLLKTGGTSITMSPILLNPDKLRRKRDFDFPEQHIWILTEDFLKPYLEEMFSEVKFTTWQTGHEMIILKK